MLYEVINEWVKRWANECVREIMNNWYKMRHWIKTLMIEVLNEKRNTWVNEWRNERVRELIYAYVYERIRDVSIMYLFTKPVPPRLFYLIYFFGVNGAISCGQKSFTLVWGWQKLLSGFLAKGHLPRVSRQSRLSANDKCGCIVLMGWSLLPNALRLFQINCAPPNLGITRTWIYRLNFAQRPIFSGLRFFKEPEISDSGPST